MSGGTGGVPVTIAAPPPGSGEPVGRTVSAVYPDAGTDTGAGSLPALRVLARGRWSAETDGPPPPVAGFVISEFSPSVAVAADRCLEEHYGVAPVPEGPRAAVVLVSAAGDTDTARAVAGALDGGRRVPPLLFFQSNPNAVLGHVSSRWNLTGPVVALGAGHADPEEEAALLLDDGDADLVLILTAEPGLVTAVLYAPPRHAHSP